MAIPAVEVPTDTRQQWIQYSLEVEGTLVRYIEGGVGKPGPPVVLLHGFQSGADIWFPHTLPAMAAERHVIALDLPGFGYSGGLTEYSVESYARFLSAFLEALHLREVDLLGHSMGGQIAIGFAAARPELIRHLVLVASAGLPRASLGRLRNLAMLADRGSFHFRLYPTVARLALRAKARRACLHMIQDESIHGLLERLTMPTLVVWGSRDRVVPLEQATILARSIPAARLYIMRGCGHMPFYQKHRQFEQTVMHFLGK